MSLDFIQQASTNRVNCGADASLDIDQGTILVWVYPDSMANQMCFVGKANAPPSDNSYLVWIHDAVGNFRINVNRATTDLNALSSDSPMSAAAWNFVGATWDTAGATGDQQCWFGDLSTLVAEVASYGTQTAGSGALSDDSSWPVGLGNISGTGYSGTGLDGKIAWVGVWNRRLSLGEIRAQQFRPHKTNGCVLFQYLGMFGATATCPDWSGNGNNGTPTGTSLSPHVPIAAPFGVDESWSGQSVGAVVWSGACSMTGAGTVTAAASMIKPGVVSMTGTGVLTSAAAIYMSGICSMAGSGTLTVASSAIRPGVCSLTGSGVLTAVAGMIRPAAVVMTGTGVLTATGVIPSTATYAILVDFSISTATLSSVSVSIAQLDNVSVDYAELTTVSVEI